MKKQKGLTVIEILMVLAIISVLAAVALPGYVQDYTIRSRMSEAFGLISVDLTAFAEHQNSEGSLPATAALAGIQTGARGNYITGVTYAAADGTLTYDITIQGIPSSTITYTPTISANGAITWVCTSGFENKYLPFDCRT